MKSIWLSSLIISSLNRADSILSEYWRHLSAMIVPESAELLLWEPDGEPGARFRITDRDACLLPISPEQSLSGSLVGTARTKQNLRQGEQLFCPLYLENSATFGMICFDRPETEPDPEVLQTAVRAFASVLYSESMGSIVRSAHPVALEAEGVCVDYRNGGNTHRVVHDVNLEICEKEFTVIMGASGSGKSSLLNIFGGMLTAAKGSVRWRGTELTSMSEKERTAYRADTVGFVFQRYNLISDLTAAENVTIAASLVRDPMPVAEALEAVGMKDKARSCPSQLSGGEQQRICIARALVKRAGLLLCDEPTGALDTENASQIIRILKRISREQGIPVVVITHNPSLVLLADHCITLSNGRIVEDILQPFPIPAEDLVLR